MALAMSTDSEFSDSTTCSGERWLRRRAAALGGAPRPRHPLRARRRARRSRTQPPCCVRPLRGAPRSCASAGRSRSSVPRSAAAGRRHLRSAAGRAAAAAAPAGGAAAQARDAAGAAAAARRGCGRVAKRRCMRPDLATMSDSSLSALICSVTARRMAVVDSLASTGISITPFFSSARVSSSSLRIDARCAACPRSRRRSAWSPTRPPRRWRCGSSRSIPASGPRPSPCALPTRFSNELMTRSRSSDLLTRPTARSSSDDCRSSVCSKFYCAEPSRSEALASSRPCSSKLVAIAATSRSVLATVR